VKKIFFRKGQNLVDLALVIGVVGLAILGMQTYIQRSVQARVKGVTDHVISGSQSAGDAVNQTTTLDVDSGVTANEFSGGGRRYRTQDRVPPSERDPYSTGQPDRTYYKYDIPWHSN
jgi:hypothetical protein